MAKKFVSPLERWWRTHCLKCDHTKSKLAFVRYCDEKKCILADIAEKLDKFTKKQRRGE